MAHQEWQRTSRPGVTLALCLTLAASGSGAGAAEPGSALIKSLAGEWRVALDPNDAGTDERWFARELPDSNTMTLPGTTDQACLGYQLDTESMNYPVEFFKSAWPPSKIASPRIDEHGHLVRPYLYIGKAWYQLTFETGPAWEDKHVQLRLERVCWQSTAWLDGKALGSNDSLVAEHRYDLGVLEAGPHRLTICVDNGLVHNIGVVGHAYGPETQSRWNGVVGALELVGTPRHFVRSVRIWPAVDRRSVRVEAVLANSAGQGQTVRGEVAATVRPVGVEAGLGSATEAVVLAPGNNRIEVNIPLQNAGAAWDEFKTPLYEVVLELRGPQERHSIAETFGFRHIERHGRQIHVNGRKVFLRGTLDCCVYPQTGHPPVSVDEWLDVLGTIKQYGFNHVRYHTWCPPEAAFVAADQLGMYLAPETPFWVDDWIANTPSKPQCLGRDPEVMAYIEREMRRIADAYGNHPSFAMFCIGNEFGTSGTDWKAVDELLARIKRYDGRRIYNASTARKRVSADDFWVTHTTETVATRGIGPVHTNWDFTAAAQSTDLPVIAHETGQRPIFCDYSGLLEKFTGPLRPYNLLRFREQAQAEGLAERASAFERASALFQIVQYKPEHEAMLRTPDYGGYQLLMLNDFTGQAEALVGILDPFWQSKGIVAPEQVRPWNSPTVPLARFDRYGWTSDEVFVAKLEVAHYGPRDLAGVNARWSLSSADNDFRKTGELESATVPTGTVTTLADLELSLADTPAPCSLMLEVQVGTSRNSWRIWVYPPAAETSVSHLEQKGELLITHRFDDAALDALAAGRRVLLLAHGLAKEHTARTSFYSVYWTGALGNRFTMLGVVCQPDHPALADFPNQGHSDWQWFELTEGVTTFDLTSFLAGSYRPIVQGVSDFHHNRLLGQVFELRVGPGRLLVCGYDLTSDLKSRHAARQMRASLVKYAVSDAFAPTERVKPGEAITLLRAPER